MIRLRARGELERTSQRIERKEECGQTKSTWDERERLPLKDRDGDDCKGEVL